MKKKYIEPTLKVCVVRTHSMFAASPGFEESTGSGSDEAAKEEFNDFGW